MKAFVALDPHAGSIGTSSVPRLRDEIAGKLAARDGAARRHTRRIDLGEVNGRIFVNNSSLGLYPQFVVGNNVYAVAPPAIGGRAARDGGELCLYVVNGQISRAQIRALHETFSRVPDERGKILVLHHPLTPLPEKPGLPIVRRAAPALEAAAEAGVHLVLAGHRHRASSGDLAEHHLFLRRSILCFEAGTAISVRRRGKPNSYNFLQIERDRVRCTVQSCRTDRFETATTVEFQLAGRRWTRRASETRPA